MKYGRESGILTNNQLETLTMTQQNSRQALRNQKLDPSYILREDRYNLGELKSTKRPYEVMKGELEPKAADHRGLTSDTSE